MAEYIELRKLNEKNGGYLYKLAVQSYEDIYNNTMSKGKVKSKHYSFLGGNPITLEKKDFTTLINNEYVVSTKADGIRFLLMIGNKSQLADRHIFFVDRNKDYWVLNYNGKLLPTIANIPNCLLDGELMMWGDIIQSKDIIRLNKTKTKKPLIVYSAFDILYGPTDPKFTDEGAKMKLDMGSSGAFMGPKGGYRWPWKKRYSVLKTMLTNKYSVLHSFNKLETLFKFKMVLSPFIELKTVLNQRMTPESFMIDTYVKNLNYQFPEIPNDIKKKTDGLILTPANTEYLQGAWSFCNNELFKWKPENKLTVDLKLGRKLKIKGLKENLHSYAGLCKHKNELVMIGIILSTKQLKEESITECLWINKKKSKTPYFEFKEYRHDKIIPNAYLTVLSVMKAIKDPFSMKTLKNVYQEGIDNILSKNNNQTKEVLDQISPKYKIRCLLKNNPCLIFSKLHGSDNNSNEFFNNMYKLINIFQKTPNAELESRIRFKNHTRRQPYYNCLVSKLKTNGDNPTPVLRKTGGTNNRNENIRSSEAVVGDYYILEDKIIKKQINNFRTNTTVFMETAGYDISHIDTYVASEEPTNKNFVPTKYRYQTRYEVDPLPSSPLGITPSVLWRIDITEYGDSNKSAELAKFNYEHNSFTSIELEFAPGDQENNMWKYYEDNPSKHVLQQIVNMFQLKPFDMDKHSVKESLDRRVRKLENVTPDFIIKDYCKLVNWILSLIY